MPASPPGPPPRAARHRRRTGRPLWPLLVLSLLLAALAVVLLSVGLHRTAPKAAPLPSAPFSVAPGGVSPTSAPDGAPGASSTSGGPAAPPAQTEPSHVYVPSLGIAAPYAPIAPDHGTLEPPYWPQTVGLNDTGGALRGAEGTVLLASHVNYVGRGEGAFADLYRIGPHADVYVTDGTNRVTHWQIVQLSDPLKSQGIDQTIFAATGPRRIVLATCGGQVQAGNYERNVLAYGVPVVS